MYEFNYDDVRAKMRYYIEESGVEFEKVAQHMGVGVKTLYNYLSGRTMPNVMQIRSLCIFLDIDINELLGIKVRRTPKSI